MKTPLSPNRMRGCLFSEGFEEEKNHGNEIADTPALVKARLQFRENQARMIYRAELVAARVPSLHKSMRVMPVFFRNSSFLRHQSSKNLVP
jgi:hypothetical protein